MRTFPLFFLLLTAASLFSQQDLGLFFQNDLVANARLNPAHIGEYRVGIGLPQLSSQIYFSGPSYAHFVVEGEVNGVPNFDRSLAELATTNNFLRSHSEVQTFQLVFNQKNWSFNIHHASRSNGHLQFPKDLLALAWRGNAAFIGQQIDISAQIASFSYDELGLGGAVKWGQFQLGARVKLLSGHSALQTTRSRATLFTDEDIYQATLDLDYQMNLADTDDENQSRYNFGVLGLDFRGTDVLQLETPDLLFDFNDELFALFQNGNKGFAVDLGAEWNLNDKWQINFSALDLGKIKWNKNATAYTANESFSYDGINVGRITFDGNETIDLSNLQDSLTIVQFQQNSSNFSTSLPARFLLNVNYQLSKKWQFHAAAHYADSPFDPFLAAAIGANYQLGPGICVGATYAAMNQESYLLGANATIQLGPLQLFAMTDNIFGVFQPLENSTVNARIGASLIFGQLEIAP